jgi:hypothetical protein
MKKIISNSVKCLKCDEVIWSSHRHDFKYCKCGNVAVDGGEEYLRRVGNYNLDDCKELSMRMEEEAIKACTDAVKWADETGRNEYGTALAVIRALRDFGYLDEEKIR